uniref:BRCT domain-containing protein n=1 Tax=Trichuris muris TaxID=70415 RepID=A0A5S6QRB8_TRIMR
MSFANESTAPTPSSKVVQLVRPPEGSTVSGSNLENVFEVLSGKGVDAAWMTNEQCAQLRNKVKQPLVFAEFTGSGFERASELGCSIFGVPSILRHLSNNSPLPSGKPPNFCMNMCNLKITCTNVDRDTRDILHSMIQWMGGDVQRVLTTECRVLIAQEVGSKKYHAAVTAEIPIVTPRWVLESWKRRHDRNFHAADPSFLNEFKCPAFLGLTITVSGVPMEERVRVRDAICSNGGKFSGVLVQNETTHLVTDRPSGQKYAAASRWVTNKVHIVTSEWLYKSVKKGCCLPESYFSLPSPSGMRRCSSALETSRQDLSEAYTDYLYESRRSSERLDRLTSVSNGSHGETLSCSRDVRDSFSQSGQVSSLPSSSDLLEMSITETSVCLSDCRIWVYGFDANFSDRLLKVADFCGAILADSASTSTHLVLSDNVNEEQWSFLTTGMDFSDCDIVTFRWLVKSFKASSRLSERLFIHPLSQKLKSACAKSQPEFVSQQMVNASSQQEGIENILSQYAIQDEPPAAQQTSTVCANDDTSATPQIANNSTGATQRTYENVFNGQTFRVLGFNSAALEKLCSEIKRLGGVITARNPKYLVTPSLTRLLAACDSNVELVSPFWIKSCSASKSVASMDGNPLLRSYYLPDSERPLVGCVLCFSQFHGSERAAVAQLATGAGAKVQDVLSRFSKNDILATTHLVLRCPQGDKYRSARKWKVPCVNVSWLVDCIRARKRVDPEPYQYSVEGEDACSQASVKAADPQQNAARMAARTGSCEKRPRLETTYNAASVSYCDFDRTYHPKWKFGNTSSMEEPEPKQRAITFELASALVSAFERVNAQSAFEEENCSSRKVIRSNDSPSSAFKNPLCKRVTAASEWAGRDVGPMKPFDPLSDAAVPASKAHFQDVEPLDAPEDRLTQDCLNLGALPDQGQEAVVINEMDVDDEQFKYPSKEDVEMRESLKQRLCSVLQMRSAAEKESSFPANKVEVEPLPVEQQRRESERSEEASDQLPVLNNEYEDVVEAPVDWDDVNQRYAREQIGSLLKEHDQATQSSTSTMDKDLQRCPLFLFTLLGEEQRRRYQSVLMRLNIRYSLTSSYDPACTHLVAGSLGRTSKVLSAIARGCWVLHPSFLEACDKENCLVPEEQHEWSLVGGMENDLGARMLAAAVRRWRLRVQEENRVAFDGWHILLLTRKKQKGIVEMLQNGGAVVHFDVKDAQKGFLAAIDLSDSCCSKAQWLALANAGVLCFKLEYIVGYLLDNPFDEKPYQLSESDFDEKSAS